VMQSGPALLAFHHNIRQQNNTRNQQKSTLHNGMRGRRTCGNVGPLTASGRRTCGNVGPLTASGRRTCGNVGRLTANHKPDGAEKHTKHVVHSPVDSHEAMVSLAPFAEDALLCRRQIHTCTSWLEPSLNGQRASSHPCHSQLSQPCTRTRQLSQPCTRTRQLSIRTKTAVTAAITAATDTRLNNPDMHGRSYQLHACTIQDWCKHGQLRSIPMFYSK
jgi:hypothetical protein